MAFFSFCGAYTGFLSGGPIYAKRILSVPDSQLAEDLRVVIGDWQARVPTTPAMDLAGVSQGASPLPSPDSLTTAGANNSSDQSKDSEKESSSRSFAYRLGLAKS